LSAVSVLRPAVDLDDHLDAAVRAVAGLRSALPTIMVWGAELGAALSGGARLLVAGNGGSAAQAQHLTSELVGRFQEDRRPYSAICLSAETSSLTAIGNDYGFDQSFARQVEAHGRAGDIVLLLTTSGRSPNLLGAAQAARQAGCTAWAVTGPSPNPLVLAVDASVPVAGPTTAAVQEAHQVVVHLLCRAFEFHQAAAEATPRPTGRPAW
jgi:D-inositol-3-phosphate glycosyltransferase